MDQAHGQDLDSLLGRHDLEQALLCMRRCLDCQDEADFHRLILSFSAYLGFEFVLYCYTGCAYERDHAVRLENLSNPAEWMAEYDREGFLDCDPVRHELELRLAAGERVACIPWDAYGWELSRRERKVIERRIHYGLNHGCSVYCDSESKDCTFLVSFASRDNTVDRRAAALATLVAPHLMVTRKRLDMLVMVNALTSKEGEVARWMTDGKTNLEIAKILGVSVNTVKFHIKNVLGKLQATNRQQAIAVLLAERYLSL